MALNLNINGDARRAQQALNDVANGAERAARITDQLSRSYDHLEHEATQAQRRIDELNDEISNSGPTEELNAELALLQRRLSDLGDERRGIQDLQGQFRRSTAAAQQLDHQLASTRRELDRLNDEYSRNPDPAVLRQIEREQEELQRLGRIRQQIANDDEDNQRRLGRVAAEAHRARLIRDEQARRQAEDDERSRRGFLGNAIHDAARFAQRRLTSAASSAADYADANQGSLYGRSAMLGAAIPVATTALAAAGGAVIGAAAIAAVGIGIKGAIDGPSGDLIKSEFEGLTDGLKGRLTASTADWAEPLVGGIHTFEDALNEVPMEQIFSDAKGFIEPLAEGFAGLAKGVGKGVGALVHEAGPVVERLGQEFSELGDDVNEAFSAISQGSQGGADALGDIIDLTGAAVRGFGKMVLGAEAIYQTLEDAPVTGWFHDMWAEWLESDAPEAVPAFAADLDGVAQSADGVAQGGKSIAEAWQGADAAMEGYEDTLHNIIDVQLGALDASIGWEQSLDDLSDSVKENGKTWDITTQKGRDNTQALEDAYRAAIEYRDAQVANGVQTGVANQKLNEQIAYLESLARKAGMTKEQFDQMTAGLKNFLAVDSNKTITVTTINKHIDYGVSQEGRIGSGEDPRRQTGKAYASGGTVAETGFSLVGENGPELRFMNRGDQVATAAETKRLLSGGGQSGPPVVRVILEYPDGRVIRDQLVTTASSVGQDLGQYLNV